MFMVIVVGSDCGGGGSLVAVHEVDRGLLLVFPKQPFVEWVNSFDPSGHPVTLDELWREPVAILVDEFADAEEAEKLVERDHREIFEHLLLEWHTDEDQWPATRDYDAFREWFEVRSLSTVYDNSGE